MLRINIDGNSFDGAVDGLPELEERIFRSDELKGFLTEITGSIVVHGDAYRYLRLQFKNNLFARSKVQLDTQDETTGVWTRIFDGEIKSENVRFDLIKHEATAELTDNGFFGLIDTNRKVNADLSVNSSFTGAVINSAPITLFSTFDVTNHLSTNNTYTGGPTGTITIPKVRGYYTADALRFLVDFMTDGRVGFQSDFFDYNNINNFFAFSGVFTGRQLHLVGNDSLVISWDDLFGDLHRIFNVWFTIEYVGGSPIMRVEPYEYFVRAGVQQVFEAVSLVETLDKGKLYNQIQVGCSREDRGFIPPQSYKFHWPETFTTLNTAKEDNILDLRLRKLIINSNSIKRVLPVQLRGGHELNQFVLVRGLQVGAPTPFQLEDAGGRLWRESNVDGSGFLAVNYTSNLATATGAVNMANTILDTEQNIFFGNDVYHVFDTDDELFDEVFFITFVNTPAPAVAEARSIIAAPPVSIGGPDVRAYNPDINNTRVVQNHLASFPSAVFQIGNPVTATFNAGLTWQPNQNVVRPASNFAIVAPQPVANQSGATQQLYDFRIVTFPEDAQTPANNTGDYNPLTGRFTCPPGGGGFYSFGAKFVIRNTNTSNNGYSFLVAMQHYDASNNLRGEAYDVVGPAFTIGFTQDGFTTFKQVNITGTFPLATGDYVVITIGKGSLLPSNLTYDILDHRPNVGPFAVNDQSRWVERSYFRVLSTPDTTGVVAVPDTNQVEVVIDDVEGYISPDDWNAIKAQPYTALQVRFGENKSITGRIVEVTRNLSTGEATATLQRPFDNVSNLLNE